MKNQALALVLGWLAGLLVLAMAQGELGRWSAPVVAFLVATGAMIWPLIRMDS
jgi:hypothetical protein